MGYFVPREQSSVFILIKKKNTEHLCQYGSIST